MPVAVQGALLPAQLAQQSNRVMERVVDLARAAFTFSRPAHDEFAGPMLALLDAAPAANPIHASRTSMLLGYDYRQHFTNLGQHVLPFPWLPPNPLTPQGLLVNRDGVPQRLIPIA